VRTRHFGYLGALAAFSLSPGIAAAGCQLAQLGSVPVDMQGLRPVVSGKINGVEAHFWLDTGSFFSTMSYDAAKQYQLAVTSVSSHSFMVRGAGGVERARVTTVKSFEFLGTPLSNVPFIVIDQSLGDGYAGILGQSLLRLSDVEYDLANGTVRFFKPVGCEQRPLAYWAVNTPFTTVALQFVDAVQDHLVATATINGHNIRVWFDTGAPRSFLSVDAAARAGITPDSPGATLLGLTGGIGPQASKVWSVPVDSFQLGGEKVQHTHLLMADIDPAHKVGEVGDDMPDMLLGEDFFLSHRIYVAYSQTKLYFTYNGGPLFNLSLPDAQTASNQPGTPANTGAPAPASQAAGEQPYGDTPTDADGFKRRGMAEASMQESDRAIADLTRACDLAPRDADAHYQRGLIYARDRQFKPALQDFSTAITLQPDNTDAHLARAELLQAHPDTDPAAAPEIKSDLDSVNRLVAPAAGERLQLGYLYGTIGDYPAAMEQLDQWLREHPLPNDQARGLNERCWVRAMTNRDLHAALDDCNHALNLRPYSQEEIGSIVRHVLSDDPGTLDSRGLVYLRLGNLDDAIHDYDSALHVDPNMPSSLYGRGIAELRLGQDVQGHADLAAAGKLDKDVARRFTDMGLPP
jgi:tetratricopeptide (TPR) repeat protein/predicted aspartyl protease